MYGTIPPGRMAAVVNIDGVNILGRSHDVNVIGLGKSSLDAIVTRDPAGFRGASIPVHGPREIVEMCEL